MSNRKRQTEFAIDPSRTEHGGSLANGRRKTARPIATKRPMHIVMRSSKARGKLSLLSPGHAANVSQLIKQTAAKFHIRVYRFANSGNHLHLLISGSRRKDLQDFLRTAAALIARSMTGATKGKPFGRFWDLLAYSRVVEWGKAFTNVTKYLEQNTLEALGFIPYRKRGKRTKANTTATKAQS
jgi:REP element-mobilizing transposase RayT